jgi:hypothetical protein
VVIIVPSRKTAKRTQVVRGKKGAELYETKRRQLKRPISNKTSAQIEFAQCVKISRKFRVTVVATNGGKKQPVRSEEEADQPPFSSGNTRIWPQWLVKSRI